MEKQQILDSDLLDILFNGKNKAYGAYELRKSYHQRLKLAIIGTMAITAIFITVVLMAQRSNQTSMPQQLVEISLENYDVKEKPIAPTPPPIKELPAPIETMAVTPPLIVKDADITEEDQVKTVDEIEGVRIGNFNQEGSKEDGIVEPPIEHNTGVVAEPKKEPDYNTTFTVVQIPAEFPGGFSQWQKYLERNLNSGIPVDNGAPSGKYTVLVSFTVDKVGKVSDVVAENDPGYGTNAEAIRVIAKGPNWKPAVQNGRNVIYRHKQQVSFIVSEE